MDKRSPWRIIIPVIIFLLSTTVTILSLAPSTLEVSQSLQEMPTWLSIGIPSILSLFTLFFLYIQLRFLRPLNELSESIKKVSEGSGEDIIQIYRGDAVGRLSQILDLLIKSNREYQTDTIAELDSLRIVLDQITDGIVMVNDAGEITSLNPAAERIFQVSASEALGGSVAEVLRQHQWIELWRFCKEEEQDSTAMLELPSQNIFLQGFGIHLGKSLSGTVMLLFQDLSHIRQLETTRQDFISNITHELRTPLASLKALSDTLQEGALEDPSAAKRFLGKIDTELDALTHLVAELLELSRIESGRVPLDLKQLEPSQVLSQVFERMRAQAERQRIRIQQDVSLDLPEIQADPRRIEQVLVNLLHNAIKFSEDGGEIILSAKESKDSIIFSVKDFGSGISESDLSRIFERFYKIDPARSSGGTGLGLSIAKHIIEAHGGEIWAESTLNQGSTFYFSIPLNRQE
jgi:two-component system phosphate regulon sensor histidine kinase PhoR